MSTTEFVTAIINFAFLNPKLHQNDNMNAFISQFRSVLPERRIFENKILKKHFVETIFNGLVEYTDDNSNLKSSGIKFIMSVVFKKIYNECGIDIELCLSQEDKYKTIIGNKYGEADEKVFKEIIHVSILDNEGSIEYIYSQTEYIDIRTFFIEFDSTDTIEVLKRKIRIKKDEFREKGFDLIYSGKVMADFSTLNDHGITKESIVFLLEWQEKDEMKILIRSDIKENFNLRVLSSDTVLSVKSKIKNKYVKEINEFDLVFEAMRLQDDMTLNIYNIMNESTLLMVKKSMQIHIEWDDKSITIEAEECETIKSIKYKIKEKEGVPLRQQILIFGEKQLDDWHSLQDYNILRESTIKLILSENMIQIFVKTWKRTSIELYVQPLQTVYVLFPCNSIKSIFNK